MYHNKHFDNNCHKDPLEAANPNLLDKWLLTFIVDIMKVDAGQYAVTALYSIFASKEPSQRLNQR